MATPPEPKPPKTACPDLTERWLLKSKYRRLQQRWTHATENKKNLTVELEEKAAKVQQLQDEVDLLLDQIQDADYEHLKPLDDELFSDDDDNAQPADAQAAASSDASKSVQTQPQASVSHQGQATAVQA
ncbi:hypothetical protein OIV83_002249 [Microbotryomycetes sp. JL201]|nr:hypothetical protein OIV83_002249 [Microbotryomycetes sp. JL201]